MTNHLTGIPAHTHSCIPRHIILLAVMALAVFASAPSGRADSAGKIEKHAHKMQKHLARYRTGTLLQIDLRDNSEALGSLGELSNSSFQIVSIDNNKMLTFSYADVAGVKKGREYIGAGSESGHHIRHWVPLVAGALIAGGGVAVYETMR